MTVGRSPGLASRPPVQRHSDRNVPGEPPASIAHLLTQPHGEGERTSAIAHCLGTGDHAGLRWLSCHEWNVPGGAFQERAQPAVTFSGATTERMLPSLHRWLESDQAIDIALDLHGRKMPARAVDSLAAILRSTSRVTSLNLDWCGLQADHVRALCEAMSSNGNCKVASLSLKQNRCDGAGDAIASLLRNSHALTALNIESCQLGSRGI